MDDACKAMLKFLMTDEVTTQHCYRGQSEKAAFSTYTNIVQCMLGEDKSQ